MSPLRLERLLVGIMMIGLLTHLGLHILPALYSPFKPRFIELFLISTVVVVIACLAHAAYVVGTRMAAILFVIAAGGGWLAEEIGVATGLLFGRYYYTDLLGPKIGSVPIAIALAWFVLAWVAAGISNLIVDQSPLPTDRGLGHHLWCALLAAFAMTAYDLPVDPFWTRPGGAWVWIDGGPYFGVPLRNFAGWVFTSLVVGLAFRWVMTRTTPRPRGPLGRGIASVPLLVYAAFMLNYTLTGEPEATRVIALFALGVPLMAGFSGLAKWQPQDSSSSEPQPKP